MDYNYDFMQRSLKLSPGCFKHTKVVSQPLDGPTLHYHKSKTSFSFTTVAVDSQAAQCDISDEPRLEDVVIRLNRRKRLFTLHLTAWRGDDRKY